MFVFGILLALLSLSEVNGRHFNSKDKITGPARNSNYWKKWFKTRDALKNITTGLEMGKFNNSVGFETEDYCIYDLSMSYIYGSPDGVRKRIIGFNGVFPGPTLVCTMGKTMVVRVTNVMNDFEEPTSIHWHGIQQNLSPFYDGPQSITQCPIIRSTSMIYKFQVFQAGTYWYHSHHSHQYVDGAWGFLIVKNTPEECWKNSYDEEILISITDWTHRTAKELTQVYLRYGIFPDTNSSLINGRGTFNCANVEKGQICDSTIQGPTVISVSRGKRYRLRILNPSAARTYNFSIDGHKLQVIETDGVDTFKSPLVDIVPMLPAQRYSVLVTMDKPLNAYWIRISGLPVGSAGLVGRAVLRYMPKPSGFAQASTSPAVAPEEPGSDVAQGRPDYQDIPWEDLITGGGISYPAQEDLQKFFPKVPQKINPNLQAESDAAHAREVKKTKLPTTSAVNPATAIVLDQNDCPPLQFGVEGGAPAKYDRLLTINVTDCPISGNPARMCMNGEPFEPTDTRGRPVIFQLIRGKAIPSSARPIHTPKHREVVRVVINNFHPLPHPWHLHGHSFWVLGTGAAQVGPYVPSRDSAKLITNGVRRDTTITFGNSWAVFTYETDNPGAWFFHCHINWHLEAGLGMTFIEDESLAKRVYKNPPLQSAVTCAKAGVSIY